ncbi:MAG: peroxiredoxin [bacterium]|jgi:peroxiredoxin (alkyl hydroperoxide reductase subunit C)
MKNTQLFYITTILLSILISNKVTCDNHENSLVKYEYSSINLLPRQKAPYWSATAVINEKFKKINSEEYKGKYTILLFYPFDFTYVCPTELIAFSDAINDFKSLNAEVIGISTDSHFTHLAWLRTPRSQGGVGKLQFPLVADISKKISKSFGVLVEDETDELFGAALRGLYIIDDRGVIRSYTVNDAPVGRSVDETLRLVRAFQYADQHGEVCPANWKPGQQTIKPDQDKKQEYFQNTYEKDI